MIVYHYDRQGVLQEGQVLCCSNDFATITKWAPESEAILKKLFPNGLSCQGFNYLDFDEQIPQFIEQQQFIKNGQIFVEPKVLWCEIVSNVNATSSFIIEQNCELVRRADFQDMPSRFQSLFCFENPADLNVWPELITPRGKLFEIEIQGKHVKLDANQLKGGVTVRDFAIFYSVALNYSCAYSYWQGKTSERPRYEYVVELPVVVGREIEPQQLFNDTHKEQERVSGNMHRRAKI